MTRVAIVTGAAGGMGRAITRRLIDDGLHVVGVDIDGAALLSMASGQDAFTPEAVDLTDPDAIARLFARTTSRFGGIDALVNNAGTCFMALMARASTSSVSTLNSGVSVIAGASEFTAILSRA
jgi:2-dehydro-3-deoxy-L-rhamnonate dehydrogenase (NAD+)